MNKYEIYNKAIKVINSCETFEQLKFAKRYCKLASKKIKDQTMKDDLSESLGIIRLIILRQDKSVTLPVNCKQL